MFNEKVFHPVRIIAMHECPHLDEVAAYLLLCCFGGELFPGIEVADVVFWPYGGETPDGKSAEDWLERGVLILGQGFGMFDEHPCPELGISRKAGHSTVSLVAQYLEVHPKSPEGRASAWLAKQVTECDLNGGNGVLGIESVMSTMSRRGRSSDEILQYGLHSLTCFLEDQIEFQKVRDWAHPSRRNVHYSIVDRWTLATAVSTSEHILKAVRTHGAHLSVRLDSKTHHVTIMSDHQAGLQLGDLVSELRRFSGYGYLPKGASPDAEGRLHDWFYHPSIGLITTGGGRGSRQTTPPRLTWSKIVATVEWWLEHRA